MLGHITMRSKCYWTTVRRKQQIDSFIILAHAFTEPNTKVIPCIEGYYDYVSIQICNISQRQIHHAPSFSDHASPM